MTTVARRYRRLSTEDLTEGENPGLIDVHTESVAWHDEEGRLHRLNGPAIKYLSGSYGYFVCGVPHREGGPALKNNAGCFYYLNGLIHNDSGPSVILTGGDAYYALDGIYLEPEKWLSALSEEARVNYLFDLNNKT